MVARPAATVRLLHGWLSDLEQWRNTRASKSCACALLWVGTRESTQRQRLAASAPKFLWAIKPLQGPPTTTEGGNEVEHEGDK